jgi:CRISPR-associated protein Csh1
VIAELTTYIEGIKDQFPLKDFVQPKTGLHIMLEVKNGTVKLYKSELYLPKKEGKGKDANADKSDNENDALSDFMRDECLPREMHIDYIESHKALIGKEGKKIHSASPFALIIRKKSFDEDWKNWFSGKKAPTEGIKGIEKKEKALKDLKGNERKKFQKEIIRAKIEITRKKIVDLFQSYFERANEVCLHDFKKDDEFEIVKTFQSYCVESSPSLLNSVIEEMAQLAKDDNIVILLKNIPVTQYESANANYLKSYIFNVAYFNKVIGKETYGLSGYYNTAADKKPYLKHLTAPFDVNNRISQTKALLLHTFEKFRQTKKAFITNPLPIFIDHSELNNEVVSTIKAEGNRVSFHEIIHKLYEQKKSDLGDYYLFYFLGMDIRDVDFVSSFSYELDDVRIIQAIPYRQPKWDKRLDNIFRFENEVLQPIFNNQLVQRRRDESIAYRYFDDIDNNAKYISDTIWKLMMKYRKAFYDFIYKSRRQSVTNLIFHDIMRQGILDDIRHDEIQNGKHGKISDIYKKLNIWFSLWDFFGKENKTNDLSMANKIEQHQERIRIVQDPKSIVHLETDDEFAFAVGQVIYYLLDQSKAGNKTHALLEPFLQKTNLGELKKTIANTFNAYKHEISFGKGRFEKLSGEIMAYELNGNLKEQMPNILAGYFSSSLIYEKSEPKKS